MIVFFCLVSLLGLKPTLSNLHEESPYQKTIFEYGFVKGDGAGPILRKPTASPSSSPNASPSVYGWPSPTVIPLTAWLEHWFYAEPSARPSFSPSTNPSASPTPSPTETWDAMRSAPLSARPSSTNPSAEQHAPALSPAVLSVSAEGSTNTKMPLWPTRHWIPDEPHTPQPSFNEASAAALHRLTAPKQPTTLDLVVLKMFHFFQKIYNSLYK